MKLKISDELSLLVDRRIACCVRCQHLAEYHATYHCGDIHCCAGCELCILCGKPGMPVQGRDNCKCPDYHPCDCTEAFPNTVRR